MQSFGSVSEKTPFPGGFPPFVSEEDVVAPVRSGFRVSPSAKRELGGKEKRKGGNRKTAGGAPCGRRRAVPIPRRPRWQVDAARNLYREQRLPEEVAAYRQPVDYEELVGDMTLNRLHEIFKSIVRKQEDKIDPIRSHYGNIEKEEIDMDAKTLYVEAYAKEHRTFSFRKLLEKQSSRMEVIVTFLVILELMKTGKILICQENIFDDIMITSQM